MTKSFAIPVLLLLAFPAREWAGNAVGISDGDTITVLDEEKTTTRIRLYGIDCPDSGQALGTRAKEVTSETSSPRVRSRLGRWFGPLKENPDP